MNKLNKRGFTLTELVIVLAIIAVLAAVLIPTFAGLIRKANDSAYQQERTNQIIQDAIEKIDKGDKYMSWEDLEEAIAKALVEKGENENLANKIIAIIKENDKETGMTNEQLTAILEAIANKKLSDIQVKVILEKEAIDPSIIDQIIAKLPQVGITQEDITASVKEVLGNDSDLAETINAAIAKATLTAEEIAEIVEQIIESNLKAIGDYVARIGTTGYESFNEAFKAVKTNETIYILKDNSTESVNYFLVNGKKITIDLNQKELDLNATYGFYIYSDDAEITLKNGRIESTDCIIYATKGKVNVNNAYFQVSNDSTIWAKGTSTIDIDSSSTIDNTKNAAIGIVETSTVNIRGTVKNTANGYAITGNGTNGASQNTTINIYDGAVVQSVNGNAIYNPQKGTINIYGGSIKAALSCVAIKAGTLNIENGEFIVDGYPNTTIHGTRQSSSGGGPESNGSCIVIDSRNEYAGNMVINITGGTFNSPYAYVISETGNPAAGTKIHSLAITGGTCTSKYENLRLLSNTMNDSVLTNSANWTITEHNVSYSNRTEHLEHVLAKCIDNGETVTLTKNVVLLGDLVLRTSSKSGAVTLNLSGYTITGGKLILNSSVNKIVSDTDNLEELFGGGTITKTDNGNGTYTYTLS